MLFKIKTLKLYINIQLYDFTVSWSVVDQVRSVGLGYLCHLATEQNRHKYTQWKEEVVYCFLQDGTMHIFAYA